MRRTIAAVVLLGGAMGALAQSRYDGYGNVVFPGTGGPPPVKAPGFRGGINNNRPAHTPQGPHSGIGRPAVFPVYYPVPLFWDSDYRDPAPAQQPPNITIVMPQQSTPPVVINQNYVPETAKPVMQEYGPGAQTSNPPPTASASSSSASESMVFLIALKDSSVYSAVAYWVDGETLHYVTPQGKLNAVSLQLVDRSVSAKLNASNNVDLHLPPEK